MLLKTFYNSNVLELLILLIQNPYCLPEMFAERFRIFLIFSVISCQQTISTILITPHLNRTFRSDSNPRATTQFYSLVHEHLKLFLTTNDTPINHTPRNPSQLGRHRLFHLITQNVNFCRGGTSAATLIRNTNPYPFDRPHRPKRRRGRSSRGSE